MKQYLYLLVILILGVGFLESCTDEGLTTDPEDKLTFSVDTLTFDTVFTDIGSATRIIKIYNPHPKPIEITSISVESGQQSRFRLNIDGLPTNEAENIIIAAEDSMYIFAEVTVDPNDLSSPYIITDYLNFETNGNTQTVVLEAWGQNALYLGSKGSLGLLSCDMGIVPWDFDRPVVVYGWLFIDSCTLEIAAGTEIHVHGGLVKRDSGRVDNDGFIIVLENGSIQMKGTADNPIVLQGDRLEVGFEEEPGQWGGVVITPNSTNNSLEHTVIKNSILGVYVDSSASLTVQNSAIHNNTNGGLIGRHATINAENSMFFSSSGGNNVLLQYGGDYDFRHCTIAGYASPSRISHSSPSLRMTNVQCYDLLCAEFDPYRLNANFQNCIITGSRVDEIALFDRVEEDGMFNITFDHCLITSDESEAVNDPIFDNCNNCQENKDALFVDVDELNYRLDSLSFADGNAIPINSIITNLPLQTDFEGTARNSSTPDIGCFERNE